MASQGYFQEHVFNPMFISQPGPSFCFGDVVAGHNAVDQAVDSMLNASDLCCVQEAQLLPMFPFDDNFDARCSEAMAAIDTLAFQSTPYLDNMPKFVTQHYPPRPNITCPETDSLQMQEASVVYTHSDTPGGTTSHGPMTGLAFPMQIQYATTEDWERHRNVFTQLYRDKKKTLREVKSIMKERYGFHATDKMYKKRISDWHLQKNCKAEEKEEILRRVEMNREHGVDLGEPIVNGRTIKLHLIERHRREKRKATCPSPSAIDGRSTKHICPQKPRRAASISFSRIEDPEDYRNYESLLFEVDQYYNARLANDPQTTWEQWINRGGIEVSYTFQGCTYTCTFDEPSGLFSRYAFAVELLKDNHAREAWRMMQEGAEMVRPLLLQQAPIFIIEFLLYLSLESSAAHDGLKMQLLHLISGMASVVYGNRHPIFNICRLLQILHWNQDVIELTYRKLRDVIKRHLGQTHLASAMAQFCWVILDRSGTMRSTVRFAISSTFVSVLTPGIRLKPAPRFWFWPVVSRNV